MSWTVDEEECIGCESCVELCPDVFKMDEASGKAVAYDEGDPPCAEEAQGSCPVEAIKRT
jgi:ferredoxin